MSRRSLRSQTRSLRRALRRLRYAPQTPSILRVFRWSLAILGVGYLAWIVVTGLLAKQELTALQRRLGAVQAAVSAGDIQRATELARAVPDKAQHAHSLATGPVWWTASKIPYLGQPAVVIRSSTAAADRLSVQVVPRLIETAERIDPGRLRRSGSSIDIDALAAQAPNLTAAAQAIDQTSRMLRSAPGDTWLGTVNTARMQLAAQLNALQGYADAAARVSRVLPIMLGQHRTQRYFIGLQNEAELRGTGGLPGAFAIVTARRGTLHFDRFESDLALQPVATGGRVDTGLDLGSNYRAAYDASAPTTTYVDSNVSPNFRDAAQIWATMWEKVSGERVDGVLALDPTSLQYFLSVVGPATLPNGAQVSATNVVSLTERDQYAIFSKLEERKAFVVAVLRAAAKQLLSGQGSAAGVLRAASLSARQQRLLVWSRNRTVEGALVAARYAGVLPAVDRPLSAPILNNAAAGKLDYYLSRSLKYQRTGCGSTRDVVATLTLRNNAPASGLPPYVDTRLDRPPPSAKPGDNRALFDYFAIRGAVLQNVTVNGRLSTASGFIVSGHQVFRMDLELPRGTTLTVRLHLTEPAGKGPPVIWRQPGVTPLAVQSFNQSC